MVTDMRVSSYQMRGFSLIELLVTLVIFSVGLLSIAGLQTVSKQANYESLQRTTASQVAYGLLEDMRLNGDAIDIYAATGELGDGSIGSEPAPNCTMANPCNAAQKAAHDLWVWEQAIDGNLETNAGAGTGGLVQPTLCINGPVGSGAGIYQVTIAWRGTASLNSASANACGSAGGKYGSGNEFRRIIQIPTFIDPNI